MGLEKMRDVLLYVAAAFAMFSIACAVYQAMNKELAAASVLAAMGVALTMIVFLPKLEVFKAFGIEARLTQTLDRAEEILGKLRRLSLISAKSNYMSLAWNNRMDGPTALDKQMILDQVDKQLAELNVSTDERSGIVAPFVHLIGWDFYAMYVRTVERYVQSRYDDLVRKLNTGATDPSIRQELEKRAGLLAIWRQRVYRDGLFARAQSGEFDTLLKEAAPDGLLDDAETKSLVQYQREVSALFKACVVKGGYTIEAAIYYDKYRDAGGNDRKIIEFFGYNPSELK